ncbi:hypothetical protein M2322_002599 [Rhodoblastus acidophilus]|uniref:hypothetical protein n=1 Tax=Rhodoblastus acidophilus TaxID=1074 RepID=UPI0022253A04|nr:hypothetical protein [Rhodoblastus acidophilus]MCW2317045.1 hypothetical protein [Rhodoblastus acidophilus]
MAIVGSWKLTLETPFGVQTPTLRIEADGSGGLGSSAGEVPLTDLQVAGDSAEFRAKVPTPMGSFNIGFDVTADGDALSGQFKTPLGSTPLSGVRQG